MVHFIGFGAQKSGTSWLFENLSRHDQIAFPGGKEVHFWDRRLSTQGVSWYRNLFAGHSTRLLGDITPAYAVLPEAVIREIWSFSPDSPLIYLMRNPIDRSWSHALMRVRRRELDYDSLPDDWFLEMIRTPECMGRSDHETVLRNWMSVYPRRQLCLQYYDDIKQQPGQVLGEICEHLGVDVSPLLADASFRSRVFEGLSHPLRPRVRQELLRMYTDRIVSLGRFVGRDLSPWIEES